MPPRKAKHEINNSFKTPLEKSAFAQPESENSAPATDANTDPTKPSQLLQSKERFELEKEQVLCDLEENINESILSGDISNLSTVSTFSKDLIDACANASAEMLDLHLTPYDLKSVHEYQISNDKKLSKILKIVEKVLSENAELK